MNMRVHHAHLMWFPRLAGWEWEGPWEAEDWTYAPDWSVMSYPPTPSSKERNLVDFVRRRRWVRRRRRQQISPGAPHASHLLCACMWSCLSTQATLPLILLYSFIFSPDLDSSDFYLPVTLRIALTGSLACKCAGSRSQVCWCCLVL